MAIRRPPVIPEIAKAYQNDPATQLALAQLQTGGSTAPVAGGNWAYADGIARALTGAIGGYTTKKQQEKYGGEEADLLALRKARGVDGLNGAPPANLPPSAMPAPTVPATVAPGGSPQAVAAASALGAPPPAQAPPGPPQAVPQPSFMPGGGQQLGGVAPGRAPFGRSAANAGLTPPVAEPVPDAPAPVARPNAPVAEGPTRSKYLDAAYRIMADANPYESAAGQEAYMGGLQDQDKLNESAAERRQRIIDLGYQSDLGAFNDAQSQDRGATIRERSDTQQRNFTAGEAFKGRSFEAGENDKNRSAENWRTRYSGGVQMALEKARIGAQQAEGALDRSFKATESQKDRDAGKYDRRQAASQAFFGTKAGREFLKGNQDAMNSANRTLGTLELFKQKMQKTPTGGLILNLAPSAVSWANGDIQFMESLSNQLALANSKDMKGSLSDKDVVFLMKTVPSIRNTRKANEAQLNQLKGIAQRQKQFALASVQAAHDGQDVEFMRDWSAYTDSVPSASNVSFDQWRSSAPQFDRNGVRVK